MLNHHLRTLLDAVPVPGWVFAAIVGALSGLSVAGSAVHLYLKFKAVMAAIHAPSKEDGDRALKVIDKLNKGRRA